MVEGDPVSDNEHSSVEPKPKLTGTTPKQKVTPKEFFANLIAGKEPKDIKTEKLDALKEFSQRKVKNQMPRSAFAL